MNKKRLTILALLMTAVIILSLGMFVACNNDSDSDSSSTTIEATKGLLITNSDFKVVGTSSSSYPRTVSSWTGAKMYSAGTYADDVIAGAINLTQSYYNEYQSNWNDTDGTLYDLLTADGRYGDSDEIKNALMVYMPTKDTDLGDSNAEYGPTAYGYTSTSFTLAKGAYYKLTVDVLTHNIAGDESDDNKPGARIYLSSNTYAEFDGIDTKGEWKTYEIYIEASASASSSLSIMLGLGKSSSSYSKGLTTGYAFFDNVMLEEIKTTEEGTAPETIYQNAQAAELADNSYIYTTTLKVANGRFDFGTAGPSASAAPSNWSVVTGNSSDSSDSAPTSLGYNGIIDASFFNDEDSVYHYSKYSRTYYIRTSGATSNTAYVPSTLLADVAQNISATRATVGNNIYVLSQQLMTAQGIRSSRTLTVEKNKIYALSINLYTYDIHGEGVTLLLQGSGCDDVAIKGISSRKSNATYLGGVQLDANSSAGSHVEGNSTKGWETFTFYIHGNQFRDYTYNMSIWLGTGGRSDNTAVSYTSYSSSSSSSATTYTANGTFSTGWVFMDDIQLNEIETLPATGDKISAVDNNFTLDLTVGGNQNYTGAIVDLSTKNEFSGTGNDLTTGTATGDTTTNSENKSTQHGIPKGWSSNFDITDDSNPVITGGVITEGLVDISSENNFSQTGGIGKYPDMPYSIATQTAFMLASASESSYEVQSAPFTIKSNGFYRISLWVKTVDLKSTSGIYVYLHNTKEDEVLSEYTLINTSEYDEYTNDWCELTFVIRGANNEDTDMYLRFSLGTGTRFDAATLTNGAAFVSNMSMTEITYAAFSGTTTGTYVKSIDLSTSTKVSFTNGSFDQYDLDADNLDPYQPLEEQKFAGAPSNWTLNDNTLGANSNDSNLVAGTIKLQHDAVYENSEYANLYFAHSNQTSAVFPNISSSVFDLFYGDKTSPNYIANSLTIAGMGGNMLAIGSNDGITGYAAGFQSDSISLSANNYYKLSVWVKTVGNTKASVFLSGEASSSVESTYFSIENNTTSDWTEYIFYVEVGLTSISVRLNLWLGYNTEYINVETEGAELSTGAVFFDAITQTTIDEDKFDEADGTTATTIKLSFLTDSFDAISSTVASRSELTSPSGWTGSADTSQSTSNSKYGVIYADSDYLDVDDDGYVTILGEELDLEDMTITDEELAAAKDDPANADKSEEDLIAELKQKKLVETRQKTLMPISELTAHSGKRMLIINNTKDSAYYYSSSTMTMTEESYYKVSVWARTYAIEDSEGKGAYIELYLGSANEATNPFIFKAVRANDWTQYTFYVATLDENVTSVRLRLGLGKYYDSEGKELTSGYAMFDDVTIEKVDLSAEEFEQLETNDTTYKRTVIASSTSGKTDDDGTTTTPDNNFNLEYLWWMIPSIILGLLIIVVVIVLVVRKIKLPKKTVVINNVTTPSEAIEEKRDKYEDNKE